MEREPPEPNGYDLPVLRRRLYSHRAPARWASRPCNFATRPHSDSRQSLHQRTLRVAVLEDSASRRMRGPSQPKRGVRRRNGQCLLGTTGYVDKRRIGITGGSYGGHMTIMAIGKTPDVRATGVEEYGIINWLTMMQHEDPLPQQHEKSLLGDPQKDRTVLQAASPLERESPSAPAPGRKRYPRAEGGGRAGGKNIVRRWEDRGCPLLSDRGSRIREARKSHVGHAGSDGLRVRRKRHSCRKPEDASNHNDRQCERDPPEHQFS